MKALKRIIIPTLSILFILGGLSPFAFHISYPLSINLLIYCSLALGLVTVLALILTKQSKSIFFIICLIVVALSTLTLFISAQVMIAAGIAATNANAIVLFFSMLFTLASCVAGQIYAFVMSLK